MEYESTIDNGHNFEDDGSDDDPEFEGASYADEGDGDDDEDEGGEEGDDDDEDEGDEEGEDEGEGEEEEEEGLSEEEEGEHGNVRLRLVHVDEDIDDDDDGVHFLTIPGGMPFRVEIRGLSGRGRDPRRHLIKGAEPVPSPEGQKLMREGRFGSVGIPSP